MGAPLVLAAGPAALVVALLALPLLALLWRTVEAGALLPALRNPTVVSALQLSLMTSLASLGLAIACGTPLAYALARVDFPGRGAVEALVEVPIVLPPAVAGIALLMAFGRRGLWGATRGARDHPGFHPWAVVLAQCLWPPFLRPLKAGFQGVDRGLERTAYTLGESLPWDVLAHYRAPGFSFAPGWGGVVLGAGPGEFGATIMFAGSFRGRTQTMPLAIYARPGVRPGPPWRLGRSWWSSRWPCWPWYVSSRRSARPAGRPGRGSTTQRAWRARRPPALPPPPATRPSARRSRPPRRSAPDPVHAHR